MAVYIILHYTTDLILVWVATFHQRVSMAEPLDALVRTPTHFQSTHCLRMNHRYIHYIFNKLNTQWTNHCFMAQLCLFNNQVILTFSVLQHTFHTQRQLKMLYRCIELQNTLKISAITANVQTPEREKADACGAWTGLGSSGSTRCFTPFTFCCPVLTKFMPTVL